MSELADPLWPVMQPRGGSEDAVQEMNARMICFHPAFHRTRRDDHHLLHESHEIVGREVSIADLFRRIGQNENRK